MPTNETLIAPVAGEPVLATTNATIASVVHAAHEDGPGAIVDGSSKDLPQLSAEELEQVLTFCAEQRCSDMDAACSGCRLSSQRKGIDSLDAWINQHRRVTIGDNGGVIEATGKGDVHVPSLAWLGQNWAGEEYWFWARRVLRKLRYGVRQVDDLIDEQERHLSPPSVILVEPQIPDNIGMVARAMGNFALDDLRIVKPRDGWPSEKARAVASGAAAIIDDAGLHQSLNSAISDLNWVAATTARQRDLRKPVMTPEAAAREMTARIKRGERCGILFGRERNGLESDEVALADAIVMIPINNRFASLNLAQSVLLLGYEWLKAAGGGTLGRVTNYERPVDSGINLGTSRKATKQELIGLFEHLERELEARGFFHPSHRRHVVVRNIRTMLTRTDPTDQEVRTMRGIVATLSRAKRDTPGTAE
jgi:tRNA/rRNA methyltransferase